MADRLVPEAIEITIVKSTAYERIWVCLPEQTHSKPKIRRSCGGLGMNARRRSGFSLQTVPQQFAVGIPNVLTNVLEACHRSFGARRVAQPSSKLGQRIVWLSQRRIIVCSLFERGECFARLPGIGKRPPQSVFG